MDKYDTLFLEDKDIEEIIDKSKPILSKYISIKEDTGEIEYKVSQSTNENKIFLLLAGAYIYARKKKTDNAAVKLSDISIRLRAPSTTLSKPLGILVSQGYIRNPSIGYYELNPSKMETYLNELLKAIGENREKVETISKLKETLSKINDKDEINYVEEALNCLDAKCPKASVIMGWVAAMQHIYSSIGKKGLKIFNAEYIKKFPKNKRKEVRRVEDLCYYDDNEILDIAEEMKIIPDRNVKKLIKHCLDLRNSCGHPSKYKPEKLRVQAYFEDIINNILIT